MNGCETRIAAAGDEIQRLRAPGVRLAGLDQHEPVDHVGEFVQAQFE